MAPKQGQNQGDIIRSFTLGNKELDGKTAEFQYDKGQYTITDIVGEERNVVYKSRNAQEAYTKWNVYIGRKKERPERQNENAASSDRQGRGKNSSREESGSEQAGRRQGRAETRPGRRKDARPESGEGSETREETRSENTGRRQERLNRGGRRNNVSGHESTGGYHQGFSATAGAAEAAAENGGRRPRRRRNNHRGQEKES
jgi:hypothetical protein